ncbi:DNA -binding domain-containing protein [Phenylobacterium sp.]|uniref:DNA -binding domain-containing protein n=1 Tax=Phenylobacterium sp. TaxID=1871053 RepID=UPI003BA8C837
MTDFLDEPPQQPSLTDYDRAHLRTYLRLLDAADDGADWREAVSVIFGLDIADDPDRARRVHDSHLGRARWMTEHGYRDLLRQAPG